MYGYLLASTTTLGGYIANENGIWIVNGVVQSRQIHQEIGDEVTIDWSNDTGTIRISIAHLAMTT